MTSWTCYISDDCTADLALCMQLLRDVRAFQGAILREEGKPDTVVLASKLAAVGYKLTLRIALGGGSGRSCFHNLHHEFLLVTGDPEFGSPQDKEYIVDPYFRCMLSPRFKRISNIWVLIDTPTMVPHPLL